MLPRDVLCRIPPLVRPNTANVGYGLFAASNAAIVMGGAFPFLPVSIQTPDNMFFYYLAQSLSFGISLFIAALVIYRTPSMVKGFFSVAAAVYFAGCCCTIAVMYLPQHSLMMFVLGGVFLGMGSVGFHLSWQRVFASQPNDVGNKNLIVGTAYSAIVFFALYLVPIAVTQLLIAFVLLPLFVLLLVLEVRKSRFDQPMFTDTPAMHAEVYWRAMRDYWRSAVCIGTIGLASGVIRSIAIIEAPIGAEINAAAIAGSFFAAAALLAFWRRGAIKFSVTTVFNAAFPFFICGFVLLPFFGTSYSRVFPAALYMVYSAANMLMLMQCAQSSRDRGVNPAIIFGCFAGVVSMFHDLGFVSGYSTIAIREAGLNPYWAVSLIAVALLALAHFLGSGGFSNALLASLARPDQIELIELSPRNSEPASCSLEEEHDQLSCENTICDDGFSSNCDDASEALCRGAAPNGSDHLGLQLGLTEKFSALQRHYRLTDRETEVMIYLAKGRSMRLIAEELVVSENTIRTHSKHIYSKLGIHKRGELQDLIGLFEE